MSVFQRAQPWNKLMYYRFVLNGQEEHSTLLSSSVLTNAHCTLNIKVLGNTGTYIVPWSSVVVSTNTDISDSGQGNHISSFFHVYIYIYIYIYIVCISVILCKTVLPIIFPVCYLSMYSYAAEFIIVKNRYRRSKK